MPIPGPSVAQQLHHAYQAGQQALSEARSSAHATGQMLENLSSDRRDALADLARHYLPELTFEAVQKMWSDVRQGVEAILLRQQDQAARLSGMIAGAEQDYESLVARIDQSAAQRDALATQQEQVSGQLSSQLAADEGFRDLTQRAAEAEAALERAEASLEEIEHEAMQKLPEYEKNSLFMYLYKRGLATPTYTWRGFTRRMDRWVGGLINYQQARQGYEYLKTTPQKVRELIAQDREALNVVMTELERRRDQAAAQLGLPEILQRVEQAEQAHREMLASSDRLRGETDRLRLERTQAENPTGRFYQEAIEYLKSTFDATHKQQLTERARRTPDPRDDQIVARLLHVDDQVQGVTDDAHARQQQIEWLDRYLADLGMLHQRFRAAGYDAANSMFDDSLNLVERLRLVREGRDSIDEVWQMIRHTQRFGPTLLEATGEGLARVARHPLTHVLVHAMAQAAGEAMMGHARRAGDRRSRSHFPGGLEITFGSPRDRRSGRR